MFILAVVDLVCQYHSQVIGWKDSSRNEERCILMMRCLFNFDVLPFHTKWALVWEYLRSKFEEVPVEPKFKNESKNESTSYVCLFCRLAMCKYICALLITLTLTFLTSALWLPLERKPQSPSGLSCATSFICLQLYWKPAVYISFSRSFFL